MKKTFKKVILLFIPFLLLSCASLRTTKDLEDIGAKIEYLGTVKCFSYTGTWNNKNSEPDSEFNNKLYAKLAKKAQQKYGKKIDLKNIVVEDSIGINTGIYTSSITVLPLSIIAICENTRIPEGLELLLVYSPFLSFLGKVVVAEADVVRSETNIDVNLIQKYSWVSNDEFDDKLAIEGRKRANKIKAEREREEREREEKEALGYYDKIEELKNNLINRGKQNNAPIVIEYSSIVDINSANGVSCKISFDSISDNIIKYVNFDLEPYNRVFDKAYSELDGESIKRVNITNLISPNSNYTAKWENVWYNSTILYYKIKKIEVIYFDNSKSIIDNPDVIDAITFTASELEEYEENLTKFNSVSK